MDLRCTIQRWLPAILLVIVITLGVHRNDPAAALLDPPNARATVVRPATSSSRAAVPSADEQARASKLIEEAFGSQLAVKDADGRRALALKLLSQARETADDSAARYCMLCRSRDLAIEAIDPETTFDAIGELTTQYDVDGMALDVEALQRLCSAARAPDDCAGVVIVADNFIEIAIREDRWDLAKSIAAPMVACAKRSGDATVTSAAEARQAAVMKLATEHDQVAKDLEVLKSRPTDPAANLSVGRFRCFVQRDWTAGLPRLACGSDLKLRSTGAT